MAREQRMCIVAMRHLSGIQKGIQGAHAVVEYSLRYGSTAEYKRWAKRDKTIYLLESHNTNLLYDTMEDLRLLKVNCGVFFEPDLNDSVTAICFLLDREVWDTKRFQNVSERIESIRQIKNRFSLASN